MEPLVSVCMPCHNAEKYVGEAIESVLDQSYKNIELIIVDDGSTDKSREVLARYKGRGVKVITQDNQGQCAAANRSFSEAKGDYVKFFDADDILASKCIEAQINRMAGRKNIVASSCWGRFFLDDIKTFRLSHETVWQDMDSTEWLVKSWLRGEPMMQCGLWLIPRCIIERVGGWDESLSLVNDFEFFSRILCNVEKVLFCPEAVLYYRSGITGSLSSMKTRAARESECKSVLNGTSYLLARRNDYMARLASANICQTLIYKIYPKYSELRKKLQERIDECGGANIQPTGGRLFNLLKVLFGWKIAKIILQKK